MRLSPLQLDRYFVTEFSLTANSRFDTGKGMELDVKDLGVESLCKGDSENPRRWEVTLRIKQQAPPDTNAPYSFALVLVGLFRVHDNYPQEQAEMLVRTNGPSVLYGVARELVRSITAQGPFGAILLPTASFYEPKQAARVAETSAGYSAKSDPASARQE